MKEKHSYDLLYFVKNDFKFKSNDIDKVRKERGKLRFGRVDFMSTQKRDDKELLKYCAETYFYNHCDNSTKKIYLIAFDLYDICIGQVLFDCSGEMLEPKITFHLRESIK